MVILGAEVGCRSSQAPRVPPSDLFHHTALHLTARGHLRRCTATQAQAHPNPAAPVLPTTQLRIRIDRIADALQQRSQASDDTHANTPLSPPYYSSPRAGGRTAP